MALEDVLNQSVDLEFVFRLLVAAAIGALIGLERERHRESRTVLAGIRTYPLAALSGVIFVQLATLFQANYFVAIGAAAFAGFALLLFWVRHTMNLSGLTSPVAFFATYLVGVLVGLGLILEGMVAGVAVTILLFTKARLHRMAEVMTESEMASALQFIVLAFVLLPLLRSEPVDPWGILNPWRLVLIVVFVASISFASFLAMRIIGVSRGVQVSGMLGGLVNSEATTVGLAHLSEKHPAALGVASVAVVLANATMLVRNLIIVAFVDPSLRVFLEMLPALGAMFVVLVGSALLRGRPERTELEPPRLKSPFAIWPALQFALLFLLVQAVATLALELPTGTRVALYLTALGGLVSSAAVVASMGSLAASGQLPLEVAGQVAVLAVVLSVGVKYAIARYYTAPLARRLAVPVFGAVAAGLVVLLLWAAV